MPDREWRGLAIDDLDGIYLEVTKGFLAPPKSRGTDYIVSAKTGRHGGNRVADVLDSILLEGYIRGDDPAAWLASRIELLATCDESGLEPGLLVVRGPDYGLAVGVTASINARVKNVVEGPIIAYRDQSFSIELTSIDPYWTVA